MNTNNRRPEFVSIEVHNADIEILRESARRYDAQAEKYAQRRFPIIAELNSDIAGSMLLLAYEIENAQEAPMQSVLNIEHSQYTLLQQARQENEVRQARAASPLGRLVNFLSIKK